MALKQVIFYVTEPTYEKLQGYAKARQCGVSQIVRDAVLDAITLIEGVGIQNRSAEAKKVMAAAKRVGILSTKTAEAAAGAAKPPQQQPKAAKRKRAPKKT